ncbi:kinase-like domain-containing protein [Russula earlei]|uniref:Kinase-like domain-containing protein n=1 Tax=Russula earlei TaxID=71964 RepID=A0ACC0TXS3_9AGAM|nr:kinase-like domain-containing protein [Russula earlei]
MLNIKLQSHVQSLVHPRVRSGERPVSAVEAQSPFGTPCLDDYEFLRTLGAGANATVYLVRENRTSHLFALKAVDKYSADGRKIACSTVINEQTALTKLNGSDCILPLHTCFHDTENYYLVTEYLPGGDLERLQRSKVLDVEAVRFYMAELLLAIEHVHAHDIIHRDIKPENIFIDTDGHIVLGDFGIAWLFDESSPDERVTRGQVGTPAFSSPEVLSGDEYGFGADLWAFGVILYEMLTGTDAFETNTVPADDPTWLRHFSEHVKCDEPVMVESPLMTDDAMDLVRRLLVKSADSRLSDITAIKNHPFFSMLDWTSVASRSLTPPWIPRLISTRQVGVHFQQPVVYAGEQYAPSDDPLPSFAFRVEPSSLSFACARRQLAFALLDGCAPLVSWVDGPSREAEVGPS